MLNNTSSGKRLAGQLLVVTAVAAALPLTATRAIEYVDVEAPAAPLAPVAPLAPLAPAALAVQPMAPVAPAAPLAPLSPTRGDLNVDGDIVTINGERKRWDQLTPAERQHIRSEIAKAKAELARTRIDRAEIERDVREAMKNVHIDKEELRRDLADARIEIAHAMREIDANAVHIRRAGQDPEAIKAQVRASLKAVEAINVEAITRQALASVDHAAIAASVASAETAIAQAQAELDRVEIRIEQAEEQFEDDD